MSIEEIKDVASEANLEVLDEGTIFKNNKYSMHMDGMLSADINYYKDPYVKILDGATGIYKIKADEDYRNATYRHKPTRKEY